MPKSSGRGHRGEAPPSPQSIAKWTLNVDNVLTIPEARRRFKSFLTKERNKDALDTLYLWRECSKLKLSSQTDLSIERAKELAERVQSEDLSVNLDESLLTRMFEINDATSLQGTLSDVLKAIKEDTFYLGPAYVEFCTLLNKSH